tara:strand:+ start:75 stop:368 length:294 start_codon:yes stop_codon:yes gene_type:complete
MLKKSLTRKKLRDKIFQDVGFSKNFSSALIDDFFESLTNEIVKESKVKITSFGTFKILNKKERVGRNPKTKIEAKISARKVVKFIPSSIVKEKLNKK